MSLSVKRLLVAGVFCAAVVFHLAVVNQDFPVLAKNGFLYDDSFYAFKIAHSLATGTGASFDGIHPTNGFQPLYVFLLVPFYWLFPSNLVTPIYAALMLSALFTALTAVLLFKILGRYTSSKVALLLTAIWAFSPVVTKQAANGLETSLALLLFASVVHVYLSRIRAVIAPPTRSFVVLGVLVGLAMLARIDEVFLGLVVLLDYLLVLRKRRAGTGALKGVFAAVLTAVVAYSPWVVYNAVSLGGVVQDSGTATRYLSLAYAPFFGLGSTDVASSGPSAGFLWGNIVHSFSVLKLSPPLHAFFRGAEKLGVAIGAPGTVTVLADVVGLALAAAFVYVVVLRKRSLRVKGFDEIQFLLILAVVIIAAYSLYVFGAFFFVRYFYPIYFILCIYAGLLFEELFRRLPLSAAAGRWSFAVILAGFMCAFSYMAYTCACKSYPIYCFYDAARWVEDNTSPDDTIGVFQSGAIGYFAHRRVINLDGKVNSQALQALKGGRLGDYLRREGIDVVIDNKNVLELFLTGGFNERNYGDPLVLLGLHRLECGAKDGVPGWAAYRVNGFANSHHSPGVSSPGHALQNR